MAISFSRPDPSSPSAVASAAFTTSRKGFEQAEVREFLRMVAAELARLQEREKFLERELRSTQRAASPSSVVLDEEMVTRMLGEEAARILSVAREASSQIKVRAEEGASRLLREATDEAQRVREEAEIESSRRRHDASADAEAELQMAKQQGRDMVNEARAYRERVLTELARRRELARQQIEQLVHGRDRLLQAFERARLVAGDVMAELTPLGEPSEYVDLSPTTGPVPMMVPGSPRPDETTPFDRMIHELADVDEAPANVVVVVDFVPEEHITETDGSSALDGTVVTLDIIHAVDDGTHDHGREPAEVVALFAGEIGSPVAATDDEGEEGEEARQSADDLFARLRASRAEQVARRAAIAPAETTETVEAGAVVEDSVFNSTPEAPPEETEVDDTPFARRDEALTPIIVAAARKLKRVLADEQNEVLHTLRAKTPVRSLDVMLPTEQEQSTRYGAAIDTELTSASIAGAGSMGATGAKAKRDLKSAHATRPALDAVATDLVAPLRDRLSRCVADADGDNAELATLVRTVYREWKNQRIDEHLDDIARTAFGRGALASIVAGTPVCWMVDPNGPACPDAEDNALAGTVNAGDPFPTDHTCAPAHSGCRCMLAPVTS